MATETENFTYYEEGTGAYGDAKNLLILPTPEDESVYADDNAMWEHVNDAPSVSFLEIVNALRDARDGTGDWRGQIDAVLDILDPED